MLHHQMAMFAFMLSILFSSQHIYGITTTFQIGIGGSIETYGSLLSMPDQMFHITGQNITTIIDTPTYITCSSFLHGNIVSSFCPDPFLYFQWEHFFTKLLQMHSFIKIKNLSEIGVGNVSLPYYIKYDCPAGGTILSYGDSQCKVEGLTKVFSAKTSEKCQRLVPMVLPAQSKILSRQIQIGEAEDAFIPCVSKLYICGYGPKPNNITFTQRKVPESPILADNSSNSERDLIRNAQSDCLMSLSYVESFQAVKQCVAKKPIYNIADFNTKLHLMRTEGKVCFGNSNCEYTKGRVLNLSSNIKCFTEYKPHIIGIHNSNFEYSHASSKQQHNREKLFGYFQLEIIGKLRSSTYLSFFLFCMYAGLALFIIIIFSFVYKNSCQFKRKTFYHRLWEV